MTDRPVLNEEIEITPEMIEAGSEVILCEVGGANLGGFFDARDLAVSVYSGMTKVAREVGEKRPARNS